MQTLHLHDFHGKLFDGDDGSQNMFVYQHILNTLGLKKTTTLIILLAGNQKGYIVLNLSPIYSFLV